MAIPSRIRERLIAGLKRLVPIVAQQKDRDVSEADTVTIVKDVLSEVFGYDKYTELTGEHAIRGTYCDLAVKLDSKLVELIEVKSAGSGGRVELDSARDSTTHGCRSATPNSGERTRAWSA